MDEAEVIRLLQSRDAQGAEELLKKYTPLFRYIIAPILQNEQDREECLSETAMRVWEGISQYDPKRGSWTGWLTAVARNTALNRQRQVLRHTSHQAAEMEASAQTPGPEEELLRDERRRALGEALESLSKQERLIFYRKYYYRQTTAQIAAELGLTSRAVEGRLYRIKQRLRTLMGGEDHG